MNTETGMQLSAEESRRSGEDRREDNERRRSARGLFELRARREGVVADRRQGDRRGANGSRSWFAFWRRG